MLTLSLETQRHDEHTNDTIDCILQEELQGSNFLSKNVVVKCALIFFDLIFSTWPFITMNKLVG